MATLEIMGRRVEVDDSFRSLSPEQQQATVNEIAQSLGGQTPQEAMRDNPTQLSGSVTPRHERGSWIDPVRQGATFGFSDEIDGLKSGVGAMLQGQDFGQAYERGQSDARGRLDNYREQNPWLATGLEVAGAIPTSVLGGGAALAGKGATLGTRAVQGLLAGGAQGAVYGAGQADGDLQDRGAGAVTGGILGAGMGAVAPYAGNWLSTTLRNRAQRGVLSQAAKDMASAAETRGAASSMFDAVDQSGAAITGDRYISMLSEINDAFRSMRSNATLDPKATGAFEVLMQVGDELAGGGAQGIALSDLHTLRQIAQKAAQSSEGRDAMFANLIVRKIDDVATGLRPADMVNGSGEGAGNTLMQAISTWSRANKVGLIENAIQQAQNQASGVENGLRIQFRRLLSNPRLARQFSEQEKAAIREVVQGTGSSNMLRLLGTFGVPTDQARNWLGSVAAGGIGGSVGGLPGAAAMLAGGTLARKGSEAMTNNAANRALAAVSQTGLNLPPMVDPSRIPALESGMRRIGIPLAGQMAYNR